MTVLAYRADADAPLACTPALPEGCRFVVWRARDGLPPAPLATLHNRTWWALDRLGAFARPDFAAIAVVRGETLLHRLVVTPRWYRFALMAPGDLQLGDLWTAPEARGQGLAGAAIAEAHRRFAGRFARMWYIVDADNHASRRVIERCGYALAGEVRRTAPLGVRMLGRYVAV